MAKSTLPLVATGGSELYMFVIFVCNYWICMLYLYFHVFAHYVCCICTYLLTMYVGKKFCIFRHWQCTQSLPTDTAPARSYHLQKKMKSITDGNKTLFAIEQREMFWHQEHWQAQFIFDDNWWFLSCSFHTQKKKQSEVREGFKKTIHGVRSVRGEILHCDAWGWRWCWK